MNFLFDYAAQRFMYTKAAYNKRAMIEFDKRVYETRAAMQTTTSARFPRHTRASPTKAMNTKTVHHPLFYICDINMTDSVSLRKPAVNIQMMGEKSRAAPPFSIHEN